MKTLIILSVALVLAQGSLVNYLREVQKHDSFKNLTTDQKLIFSELVIAAETDTLQAFIDRVGLINVLDVLDNMSHPDSQKLSAYLAEHLGYHNHNPSNNGILNKRDADSDDDDNDSDDSSDHGNQHARVHMSHAEKKLFDHFQVAAKTGMLNEYLDNVGLGSLFGVLEKLGEQESSQFLKQAKQTLANPVEKRDDGTDDATDDGTDDDTDDATDDDNNDDDAAAKTVANQAQKSDVSGDNSSDDSDDSSSDESSDDSSSDESSDDDDSSSDEGDDSDDDDDDSDDDSDNDSSDDAVAKTVVNEVEKRDDDDSDDDSDDGSDNDSDNDSNDDNDDDDDDDNASKAKLSHADKQNYKQLKTGVSVQSFLETSSLGELFGLLEKLDTTQYEDLMSQLQQQLANHVQKRDASGDDDSSNKSNGSDDDDDSSNKSNGSNDGNDDDNNSKAKLSPADKQNYKQLKTGVSVQSFLETSSLGELFGLLEKLDAPQYNELMNQLQQSLTVKKRDDDDSGDDSDDDDDDSGNKGAGKAHSNQMSRVDQKASEGLNKATNNGRLAIYLENTGLGSLFGLLEKLDQRHATRLRTKLESELMKEEAL